MQRPADAPSPLPAPCRTALRVANSKPVEAQAPIRKFARAEFERGRHVNPKSIQLIEHLLRKGQKQIALFQQPGV